MCQKADSPCVSGIFALYSWVRVNLIEQRSVSALNEKWKTVAADFGEDFLKKNFIGPNSMMIMAELAESLDIRPGMKVLNLGCGNGLTSFYLAKYFDVTVNSSTLCHLKLALIS